MTNCYDKDISAWIEKNYQKWTDWHQEGHHKLDEFHARDSRLKERTIEQCLNCTKPECNGCPKGEVE